MCVCVCVCMLEEKNIKLRILFTNNFTSTSGDSQNLPWVNSDVLPCSYFRLMQFAFSVLLNEMSIFAASLDLNGVALFWMDTSTKKNF